MLATNTSPREILAQVDRLDSMGKARLVLLVPGVLPSEAEIAVHLYLGLSGPCPPLIGAVSTSPATNGMRWLENEKVRLLLGPEGAHIYRWEVKSAGNRDLTMPGESTWEGFSDLHPLRSTLYTLNCTADGPAMVEYECRDSSGHTKMVRLYGGASWLDVLLSEPTSGYWDFDAPKNFAADGPTPGQWLFSDGRTGAVGRQAARPG